MAEVRQGLAAALALAACNAMAAGGHHAVDDAAILEPAQCELETWVMRTRSGERLLHAGPGCRVGPVELSATLDRERADGAWAGAHSVQVKSVVALTREWTVGASATPFWRPAGERGTGVLLLATWVRGAWTAHFNIGHDFIRGSGGTPRSGASVEYAFDTRWSAVGERYVESRGHYARAGMRWQVTPTWNLDLSHAALLRGSGASSWTFGSTWQFDRR
ncbi:hypothetical protein [Ramlibacter albus]|uniref:Transporter n=1 Tax=Ramlibacter albus TaxID=2079448 RepID=A0A923M576_9BURK|nr:hypothetical protein [Ramlibacter albus]MBC5764056.1 hypothetical protein [Ramlibacter albus]